MCTLGRYSTFLSYVKFLVEELQVELEFYFYSSYMYAFNTIALQATTKRD
jgi:hypothetical protein